MIILGSLGTALTIKSIILQLTLPIRLQLFYNLYNSFQIYLINLKFCSGVSNNLKQKEHKISR